MIALRTTAHTFGAYSTVGVRYVIHRLAQICAAGGAGGPKPASSLGESPTMGRMHQPRTPVPHKPDCTPNMDFLPIPRSAASPWSSIPDRPWGRVRLTLGDDLLWEGHLADIPDPENWGCICDAGGGPTAYASGP